MWTFLEQRYVPSTCVCACVCVTHYSLCPGALAAGRVEDKNPRMKETK